MTSAYLTELRQRLRVTRDRLNEELRKVPVDYTKTAIYERQIVLLLEEAKMCNTTEGHAHFDDIQGLTKDLQKAGHGLGDINESVAVRSPGRLGQASKQS
ncbi:hypothetical protein ABBQ38_013389 [Trebouxia sp. C0009 RCD-2024]